jgi:hypothetical protein
MLVVVVLTLILPSGKQMPLRSNEDLSGSSSVQRVISNSHFKISEPNLSRSREKWYTNWAVSNPFSAIEALFEYSQRGSHTRFSRIFV